MGASVAEATKTAYAADWARFLTWCDLNGFVALPADPLVLASFLVETAGVVKENGTPGFAASTMTRWVASINNQHTAAGMDPPGRTEVVRRTLAGIRKTRATPPSRVRPLRLAEVQQIVTAGRERAAAGTFADQLAERRNTALLLLGYLGAFRESELVGLDVGDVVLDEDGLILVVRLSKTDQQAAGMVKAINRRKNIDTCAPCAWARWSAVLDAHDTGGNTAVLKALRADRDQPTRHVCHPPDPTTSSPAGPHQAGTALPGESTTMPLREGVLSAGRAVFRPFTPAGWLAGRRLHRERVRGTVRAEAAKAGLDPAVVARLGGHSLRAGFVTDAMAAGARPDEIMRQTGHRNASTVEIYRRDRPIVGNAVLRLPDKK
ncbi:integrase [Nakamurella silvestris]|nr:integrase [Nakamurella silvestris]